jgi:hypothetical protein
MYFHRQLLRLHEHAETKIHHDALMINIDYEIVSQEGGMCFQLTNERHSD